MPVLPDKPGDLQQNLLETAHLAPSLKALVCLEMAGSDTSTTRCSGGTQAAELAALDYPATVDQPFLLMDELKS